MMASDISTLVRGLLVRASSAAFGVGRALIIPFIGRLSMPDQDGANDDIEAIDELLSTGKWKGVTIR